MRLSIKVSGVAAAANPLLSADKAIRKAAVRQVRKAGNLVKRAAVRNIARTFREGSGSRDKRKRDRLRATLRVRILDEKVKVTADVLPVGLGRAQGTVLELGGKVARRSASANYRIGKNKGKRKAGASARFRARRASTADYGSPRAFLGPAVDSTREQVFEMIGASFDVFGGST